MMKRMVVESQGSLTYQHCFAIFMSARGRGRKRSAIASKAVKICTSSSTTITYNQTLERKEKNTKHLIKKKNKRHDDLLYGNGRFPKLAGYAAGYWIVRDYYQKHPYQAEKSFILPAKKLIEATKYKP